MKKGFTLAEVLITIVVIGVVAALTIPVVVHKYQQKQFYTQFMKAYNTLVNGINLSVADNGSPKTWAFDQSKMNDTVDQYILPYFKIASKCSTGDSGCANYNVSYLSGQDTGVTLSTFLTLISNGADVDVYNLADGSTVAFGCSGTYSGDTVGNVSFAIDTNGTKGPNTFGRDLFYLVYIDTNPYIEGKYIERWQWNTGYYKGGPEVQSDNKIVVIPSNCDPSVSGNGPTGLPNGLGCGGRLLEEGKMSY